MHCGPFFRILLSLLIKIVYYHMIIIGLLPSYVNEVASFSIFTVTSTYLTHELHIQIVIPHSFMSSFFSRRKRSPPKKRVRRRRNRDSTWSWSCGRAVVCSDGNWKWTYTRTGGTVHPVSSKGNSCVILPLMFILENIRSLCWILLLSC